MDEDKYAGFLGDRVLPVFFSGSAKENRRILCLLSYRIFHISHSFYLVPNLNEINQKIIQKNEEKRNQEIQRRKIIRVYKMLERFIEIRIDVGRHCEW